MKIKKPEIKNLKWQHILKKGYIVPRPKNASFKINLCKTIIQHPLQIK